MKVPRKTVTRVTAKLLARPGMSEKRLGRELAAYLLAENRTGELDSLMRDLVAYRADHGVVEVTAVSAHPLSEAVRRDIQHQVRERYKEAEQIIINERIDPAAVGGVRLELIGRQLDLTVRGKLNEFKERIYVRGTV